jgi:hypothetical protein
MRIRANGPLKNYRRLTLQNGTTREREEVVLFDPSDEENEALLGVDEQFELSVDLKEAFEHFSALEQRILFRVLVQGHSVEKATARMKSHARTWRRWLSEEALPKLRSLLSSYAGDTKEVYRDLTPSETIRLDDPIATVKCKFCKHTETGLGETPSQKLRSHVSKSHRSEFKKIQRFVRENDSEIARLKEELI